MYLLRRQPIGCLKVHAWSLLVLFCSSFAVGSAAAMKLRSARCMYSICLYLRPGTPGQLGCLCSYNALNQVVALLGLCSLFGNANAGLLVHRGECSWTCAPGCIANGKSSCLGKPNEAWKSLNLFVCTGCFERRHTAHGIYHHMCAVKRVCVCAAELTGQPMGVNFDRRCPQCAKLDDSWRPDDSHTLMACCGLLHRRQLSMPKYS